MKKRRWLQILAGLLTLVLVGPLLVPVPPLEGTVPPQALGDPDSRFVEINGLTVHYKTTGQGSRSSCCCTGSAPVCTHGTPSSARWARWVWSSPTTGRPLA